ncbi:MAG TPA: helix-turn-helix transcriptional regulator [Trebonia sp.]|nr:helix-turn-helix transcriptional regulator [Trebonia sp.]
MVAYESPAEAKDLEDLKEPPASERRRTELGKFLKTRRARLSPADFDLPAGPRRRTPGLRREELALLAGVGVTWYTWLEQGREINVSTQVLDALARTLRLDRAERWHMYVLAEAVPVAVSGGRCSVPEAITEIVEALDPLPAVVSNARFDVLSVNAAYLDLFRHWHELPCVHRNSLWCTLTEPRAREQFPQYEEDVRYMVARLRAAYARHVGDPDWEEDIRRLSALSTEFAQLWARHEVAEYEPRVPTFIHPDVGPLTFTTSELQVPATPEARLVVYTPADDETRKLLPRTRL